MCLSTRVTPHQSARGYQMCFLPTSPFDLSTEEDRNSSNPAPVLFCFDTSTPVLSLISQINKLQQSRDRGRADPIHSAEPGGGILSISITLVAWMTTSKMRCHSTKE